MITQPPAQKIEVVIRAEWCAFYPLKRDVKNPSGVTLGDVLRVLHKTHDQHKNTHGATDWQWDGIYMWTRLAFPTEEQAAGDKIVNDTEDE